MDGLSLWVSDSVKCHGFFHQIDILFLQYYMQMYTVWLERLARIIFGGLLDVAVWKRFYFHGCILSASGTCRMSERVSTCTCAYT